MKPTPTPEQQALIDQSKAQKQAEIDKIAALVPLLDAQIADKTTIDEAFKAQFDYYNDDVIGQYEAERVSINGFFQVDPLVEQDVQNAVFDPTNARLFPDPGEVDVKRIEQFDGTPISNAGNETNNELYYLQQQLDVQDFLQVGLGGTTPSDIENLTTVAAVSNSTPTATVEFIDNTSTTLPTLTAGDRFLLQDGTNYLPVEVISATGETTGVCDPDGGELTESECTLAGGTWTADPGGTITAEVRFLVIETPVTVGANAEVDVDFSGFNNTERTNKTSGTRQGLMDLLVAELQALLNARDLKLTEQDTALQTNGDPDLDPTALTNVTTSKTFITNYLPTTDISDTGITSLAAERSTRNGQATARVSAIETAFTGQTENFFEQRYTRSNDRAQIRRGTLVEIKRLELAKASNEQNATDRQQSIDSFDSL